MTKKPISKSSHAQRLAPYIRTKPDQTESKIIDALKGVCNNAEGLDGKAWTRRVKESVARLGRDGKHEVCANRCKHAHGREWLYDLCWLDYQKDSLIGAKLVMEVEWQPGGPGGAEDDFQKLVLARADHRVMIFCPKGKEKTEKAVNRLLSQFVERFRHSSPGDRYLFGCWNSGTSGFDFSVFKLVS
ncbi:MAG: hypothetical protein DME22_09230 [Verrucomicrobia bacterium]|nr:MAG: hypothetical protein DME22_09230 [Verrucomicrobiota bacterium]PYK01958.1 MAG: hypothetical protein DME23_02860 [Verrucomicrobiota bacterium]